MKIRISYSPLFEHKKEHGVGCKCGYNLFFDESELTPPVTAVTCPNCQHVTFYHTPSLAGMDKVGSDLLRMF